jgi:hypothetical protein
MNPSPSTRRELTRAARRGLLGVQTVGPRPLDASSLRRGPATYGPRRELDVGLDRPTAVDGFWGSAVVLVDRWVWSDRTGYRKGHSD